MSADPVLYEPSEPPHAGRQLNFLESSPPRMCRRKSPRKRREGAAPSEKGKPQKATRQSSEKRPETPLWRDIRQHDSPVRRKMATRALGLQSRANSRQPEPASRSRSNAASRSGERGGKSGNSDARQPIARHRWTREVQSVVQGQKPRRPPRAWGKSKATHL